MINKINDILIDHKVCGMAYMDERDNFIIDYDGLMQNSSAMMFLGDLLIFSDLVSDDDLKALNEFSKRYAVGNYHKENGFIL